MEHPQKNEIQRRLLGPFESQIMSAVFVLGHGNAYGLKIKDLIADRTSHPVTSGAVYVTLDRLEEKGLLESSITESRPERGGRARRVYAITAAGARAFDMTKATLRAFAVASLGDDSYETQPAKSRQSLPGPLPA